MEGREVGAHENRWQDKEGETGEKRGDVGVLSKGGKNKK